jgi:hypothetical protein
MTMNGRKPRQIRLEALESRELLSARPSLAVSAEVARADTVSAANSSVALDGILSGGATSTVTTTSGTAQLPIRGRGIVFPLLGVVVQGTITVSGPPSNASIQGELVATGRQGSVTIDISAPNVRLSQITNSGTLIPIAVQADVVSGTGRLANERAHGVGVLQLDGVIKPKTDEAALTGTYTLALHLTPPSS